MKPFLLRASAMTDLLSAIPGIDNPGLLLLALAALVLAYLVFTLAGFGSALIASAPLALVLPVARVVPLLALLDCGSSALRGWRARGKVAWAEFRQLFPGMVLGQLLGVLVLARIPSAVMALLLGGFVVVQGCRGLIVKKPVLPVAAAAGTRSFSVHWHGLLQGIFGGILGGLFGSGGFIYAAYLERRLEQREAFRATQAVLIALSTAWRIVLCAALGLVDGSLLLIALGCLPALVLGTYLGHHVDLRLSREQLFLFLHCLLVVSGVSLILRYL